MSISGPLTDRFGRVHTDLRVSITDRCNLRCYYCMPADGIRCMDHSNVLTYEEIERFVRVASRLGIRNVRLTGGEPLVRKGIARLVRLIAAVPGIEDLGMTTNAVFLDEHADELRAAGLQRLNISLDTLDRAKFEKIARRDKLPRVLRGIEAAKRAGFKKIKLNALAIRNLSEDDVVPLALYARENDFELRFIEFMPMDGDRRWGSDQVLPGEEILDKLTEKIGPLEPVAMNGSGAPATKYRFLDGGGTIGVIPSVTIPFCEKCDRLRLAADGKVRSCLFSHQAHDAAALLRRGATQRQLAQLLWIAVAGKRRVHGTDNGDFARPDRTMHEIGG